MTQLENKSQKEDLKNSQEDSLQSTNLTSKEGLIRRLRKGRDARTRFVESHLDKKLAFQIRSLRGDSSQEKVEELTGIKQQAISRLENPSYGKATLTTLKKIAAAFDVGLLVEFVPFSQLIKRVSGTPYIERGLSPETMNVPSFDEEEKQSTLEPKDDTLSILEQSPQLGSESREMDNIKSMGGTESEMPFDESSARQEKKPPLPSPPPASISGDGPKDRISMGG